MRTTSLDREVRTPAVLLGVAVGIVLADSSVVTIALPEILAQLRRRDLDARLGAHVVQPRARPRGAAGGLRRTPPAERSLRGRDRRLRGRLTRLRASRPSFGVLVAARAVQGSQAPRSSAQRSTSSPRPHGADAPAARIWALAGIVGAALGPAVGGILTQLLGWESIFFVQAPVVLLALVALRGAYSRAPCPSPLERPHIGGERCAAARLGRARRRAVPARDPADQRLAARAAGGGARRDGHAARGDRGGPLRADGSRRSGRERPRARSSSRAGSPRSAGCRTPAPPGRSCRSSRSAPGSGSALSALTERALAGRSAQAVHGGWTIAARHAGVVLGLLLLTPIFTHGPPAQRGRRARRPERRRCSTAGSRRSSKIGVARRHPRRRGRGEAAGAHPDVSEVVGKHDDPATPSSIAHAAGSTRPRRHERVLALLPRRRASRPARARADPAQPTGGEPLMRAIVVGCGGLGCAGRRLSRARRRVLRAGRGRRPVRGSQTGATRRAWQQVGEQIVLSALDGAACKLGVSREEMVLAFASRDSLDRFAREQGSRRERARRARPRRARARRSTTPRGGRAQLDDRGPRAWSRPPLPDRAAHQRAAATNRGLGRSSPPRSYARAMFGRWRDRRDRLRAGGRGRSSLASARASRRNLQCRDRRGRGTAARAAVARALSGHSADAADQRVLRRPAGQDHDLPRPARAPVRRRSGELRGQIRHVVLHEVAHHFGISDERLQEMGRY